MAWLIKIEAGAKKDMAKLDRPVAKRVVSFLRDRLEKLDDPLSIGEALHGKKFGEFWKSRVDGIAFKPFYETYGRYSVYLNVNLK